MPFKRYLLIVFICFCLMYNVGNLHLMANDDVKVCQNINL
jgi:hypothetical protein